MASITEVSALLNSIGKSEPAPTPATTKELSAKPEPVSGPIVEPKVESVHTGLIPEDEALDKEISRKICIWLNEGKTDAEIVTALKKEYDGDFDDLIKQAHVHVSDELEKSHAAEDRAREVMGQARDRELAATLEAKKLKVELFLAQRNKKMGLWSQADIETYYEYVREQEQAEARLDSVLSRLEEQALPEFPCFTGSLHDFAMACAPDIPYEFKFMAAVAHFGLMRSGLDHLEGDEYLQPRFYVCFVKEPEWGKTAGPKEVKARLSGFKEYVIASSVDSGPALVDEFVDALAKVPALAQDRVARVLLNVDEMKDLFEKAKQTAQSKNSLANELLKLYEDNVTGNHSRKHGRAAMEVAHLAILGGATPDSYTIMWNGTGGASTGLQSRFVVISTSAPKPPARQRQSDADALSAALSRIVKQVNAPAQLIQFDDEAETMFRAWDDDLDKAKSSTARVSGFVKRLLMVLAITNDVVVITKELVQQGIRFGNYVIACREKFNPADSYSWTQAFEQAIVEAAKRHPDREMTQNDFRRLIDPLNKPGGLGVFNQAWKNVAASGALVKTGTTAKGTSKYQLPKSLKGESC